MKTYILQKDIISPVREYNLKAGSKFTMELDHKYKSGMATFISEVVENNPEWFKEEKIEIVGTHFNFPNELRRPDEKPFYSYFKTNIKVPEEKFDPITKAIERELNDDCYFDAPRLNQRLDELKFAAPKKYTEEDMRKSYYRGIMDHGLAPNARDFYFRHFLNHILK